MANFREVNRRVRQSFPTLGVEVVRGEGYVYFDGYDGWMIPSIYTHPVSTSTESVVNMCISEIKDWLCENAASPTVVFDTDTLGSIKHGFKPGEFVLTSAHTSIGKSKLVQKRI